MDLFDHHREKLIEKEQPLAARMRPRTLEEFVGQGHILAPGRLLRRAIQADRLSSVIFYGPPGTGKTTLASVIANTTESEFVVLNAVLSGVADVRRVVSEAQQRRGQFERRTILFVDEVHRWNKAQQDALLPWVENGTVILIGATTENPYFTVNRALVSRSRVFQLKPLDTASLLQVARMALADESRGYGGRNIALAEDALQHLAEVANGDARALLNALELAAETTPSREADGAIVIDMAVAEESIQRRAVLYDKEGDYHFDTISAFIKSLRGSDPDAALYWLAKMVYAGEDPRFILRRMLIFCGEDIGLADPHAMTVTAAAAEAFERVGMPEGRYHLGFAAIYLATAPKSNSVFGFFDALGAVEKEREGEVPSHLRDASRDKEGFGHGVGYLYPHAYRDHWVAQQYLPDSLQGKVFYNPGQLGYEAGIADTVDRRREAQLAAAVDPDSTGSPPEILTFSPTDKAFERWLSRTVSGIGEGLAELRDAIFERVSCQRHSTVLVANADDGLLTWEAVRRTPEGGTWAVVSAERAASALAERAEACPELRRPHVMVGAVADVPDRLVQSENAGVRFDQIIGRNVLTKLPDRLSALKTLARLLADAGTIVLAEAVPRRTQRLHALVDTGALPQDVVSRLTAAEEGIYAAADDPMVNWDVPELTDWGEQAGLAEVDVTLKTISVQQHITSELIDRWFTVGPTPTGRKSYAEHLRGGLTEAELEQVAALYRRRLLGQTVSWQVSVALFSGTLRESRPAPA